MRVLGSAWWEEGFFFCALQALHGVLSPEGKVCESEPPRSAADVKVASVLRLLSKGESLGDSWTVLIGFEMPTLGHHETTA